MHPELFPDPAPLPKAGKRRSAYIRRTPYGSFRIVPVVSETPPATAPCRAITHPEVFRDYWRDAILPEVDPARESLWVIPLSARYCPLGHYLVSLGSVNESIAHPREILRPSIMLAAHSFIMAHNHPSGQVAPSQADKGLTTRIREAANLMDIPLLDHFIMPTPEIAGEDSYFSFRENGLL